jgi:hypothetical protein
MLPSHRKSLSPPRSACQPIELPRFHIVGCVAADGARLNEGLTNIDLGVLVCMPKDLENPESLFWNFSADSSTLGRVVQRRFAGMASWRDALGAETLRTHDLRLAGLPLYLSFPPSATTYRVRQICAINFMGSCSMHHIPRSVRGTQRYAHIERDISVDNVCNTPGKGSRN